MFAYPSTFQPHGEYVGSCPCFARKSAPELAIAFWHDTLLLWIDRSVLSYPSAFQQMWILKEGYHTLVAALSTVRFKSDRSCPHFVLWTHTLLNPNTVKAKVLGLDQTCISSEEYDIFGPEHCPQVCWQSSCPRQQAQQQAAPATTTVTQLSELFRGLPVTQEAAFSRSDAAGREHGRGRESRARSKKCEYSTCKAKEPHDRGADGGTGERPWRRRGTKSTMNCLFVHTVNDRFVPY